MSSIEHLLFYLADYDCIARQNVYLSIIPIVVIVI